MVVGPVRKDGFAERVCAATLSWKKKELSVAADADQVGIDVLGADLGFGEPVVALQVDESGSGSDRVYLIYSLLKPPHLLYTIKGANSYRAADTDLDGHVEIWTNDAAAVNGFERVPVVDLDSPPTVVFDLRKVVWSMSVPSSSATTTPRSPDFVRSLLRMTFRVLSVATASCL